MAHPPFRQGLGGCMAGPQKRVPKKRQNLIVVRPDEVAAIQPDQIITFHNRAIVVDRFGNLVEIFWRGRVLAGFAKAGLFPQNLLTEANEPVRAPTGPRFCRECRLQEVKMALEIAEIDVPELTAEIDDRLTQ